MPQPPALTATLALWVGLGGAIGSLLRLVTGDLIRRLVPDAGFPWPTLLINVIGSLVIGAFLRWADQSGAGPAPRAFVAIGLCGGFTTFSTFAVENLALLQGGQPGRAAAYALASCVLTVGAAFAGYRLAGG